MSADPPVVSIKEISKVFGKGGVTALQGIELDVGRGAGQRIEQGSRPPFPHHGLGRLHQADAAATRPGAAEIGLALHGPYADPAPASVALENARVADAATRLPQRTRVADALRARHT